MISWVFDAPTNVQLGIFEVTIVILSYFGWRNASNLLKRLAPVIRIFEQIPADDIEKGARFMQRKMKEWADAERKLEEQGL